MKYLDLSLIVPVHFGRNRLYRLFSSLDRLEKQDIMTECILVADRCDDHVIRRVENWCGKADGWSRCIVLPVDFGNPDKARNLAQKVAIGKVLAFMDDDCRPSRQWLLSGLRQMKTYNAATGPVIHSGSCFGMMVATMDFGEFQSEIPSLIKNAPGCNLFVCSDAIPEYPVLTGCNYGGDRLLAAYLAENVAIAYHPDVSVFHELNLDLKTIWCREMRYGKVAWAVRRANPSLPWGSLLNLGFIAPFILTFGRLVIDLRRLWSGTWSVTNKLFVTFSIFPARFAYFLGLMLEKHRRL
jgi:glycosyltransferase involved in cell wall biosynthesis